MRKPACKAKANSLTTATHHNSSGEKKAGLLLGSGYLASAADESRENREESLVSGRRAGSLAVLAHAQRHSVQGTALPPYFASLRLCGVFLKAPPAGVKRLQENLSFHL